MTPLGRLTSSPNAPAGSLSAADGALVGDTFPEHIEPIITETCARSHAGNGPGTQHDNAWSTSLAAQMFCPISSLQGAVIHSVHPSDSLMVLLDIAKWDFDWQFMHEPTHSIIISRCGTIWASGDGIGRCAILNSNPYVSGADGTGDEM
jgi:hypothetical protein